MPFLKEKVPFTLNTFEEIGK